MRLTTRFWATADLKIVLNNLSKVDSSLAFGIYALFIHTHPKEIESLVLFVYIPAD